ncbi:neutral protease 2-like protein [Kalaharituber pfeilii]|nr:neutral protease 2-like protein [Kalaharituber pfeilii]
MVSISITTLLAFLSTFAAASPLDKRVSPLEVVLKPAGSNAVVIVSVTNTGSKDLNVLNLGTFLSESPVEKVDVFRDGERLEFKGLYIRYAMDSLSADDFTLIPAGKTVSKTVSLAGLYDFSVSGKYNVVAHGALSFEDALSLGRPAKRANGPPSNAAEFNSNELEIEVDAVEAAKRVVMTGCSGTRQSALASALSNAATIASRAATAASSGSATKFQEFFRTTSSSTRSTVAARLRAIASAASSTNSGNIRYYCNDPAGACRSNVIAYTLPSSNIVANCDIFYNSLTTVARTCYRQDRATTVIHELTHAPGVYSPHCRDYAYGYAQCTALSASQAVLNADNYALFSQAVYLGC